jgi:hypothetical protein
MFQLLELICQIVNAVAYVVLIWVLWPIINAIVAAINSIIHFFVR